MSKVAQSTETNTGELRKLNFNSLLLVGSTDIEKYTFEEYRKNDHVHKSINGYCVSCEEKGCHVEANQQASDPYKLTNISHGAHSSDFLLALKELKERVVTKDWHQEPIMFIYETPSRDYGIYKEVRYKGHKKRPSKQWYWIHEDQEKVCYPTHFQRNVYGNFVLSAIMTFKLANVYMTNLVKCGMNNEDGTKFKGLSNYKEETIKNCYSNYLENEISIINPKVIFAVGSSVEWWVNKFVKKPDIVQQLPHPACISFRNEHCKVLYFWGIAKALHKAGIIDTTEGADLAKMYLEKY